LDSDLHRKFFVLLTLVVTIKLFAVTVVTLEIHNPPRSITTQQSTITLQNQNLGISSYSS
jgi:cell division protein FtsL